MNSESFDDERRGDVVVSFPKKLYEIVTSAGNDAICWTENGKAFKILNSDILVDSIIPRYFKHAKYTSFQRQLNLYGFRRINKGENTGCYCHPLFQKSRPDLLNEIKRLPTKATPIISNKFGDDRPIAEFRKRKFDFVEEESAQKEQIGNAEIPDLQVQLPSLADASFNETPLPFNDEIPLLDFDEIGGLDLSFLDDFAF